jgi:adenosylcobinamide-GDP ribazoletransferase
MLDSVRLAVGTLTVLPTGAVDVTPRVAGRAMMLAPVAVVPLAVVAVGAGWLGLLAGWPSLVSGLLVVAALALGTRALHLDGLADTVDGLGSGRPAEGALEIMRRGNVGPMGVVALALVLGLQAAAAGELLGRGAWLVLGLVICGSRLALGVACASGVPAARPDGVAGTTPQPTSLVTMIAVCSTAFHAATRSSTATRKSSAQSDRGRAHPFRSSTNRVSQVPRQSTSTGCPAIRSAPAISAVSIVVQCAGRRSR